MRELIHEYGTMITAAAGAGLVIGFINKALLGSGGILARLIMAWEI